MGKVVVTNEAVQAFMQAFNRGEFPSQRLGQAFVNKFGHEHCSNHDGPNPGPCLFNMDGGQAAKTIWEMVTE